jgi:hypothetical protein
LSADLKQTLETINLPSDIGEYSFMEKFDLGDGDLSILYSSEECGEITLTIYTLDDEQIPDDITNDKAINEFDFVFIQSLRWKN